MAEPTPYGEVIASTESVLLGTVWLVAIIYCAVEGESDISFGDRLTQKQCAEKYDDCIQYNPSWARPGSGHSGYSMCRDCMVYCEGTGKWDCPRPK